MTLSNVTPLGVTLLRSLLYMLFVRQCAIQFLCFVRSGKSSSGPKRDVPMAAGIKLSIASPFSSFFSISMSKLTPSTTPCTSSTSENPRRSVLEMSYVPPSAAVSTPPVPLFCNRSFFKISPNFSCFDKFSSLM